MNENVPKLKDCVYIQEFDTSNKNKTFVLVCENKRWQITDYLYHIINLIDGKRTIENIAKELSVILGRNVDEKEVSEVFEKFLIKRGILEGTHDTVKKKKSSAYLWMKIPLIKSENIEKFRFLSNLFNREVVIPFIIIGVLVIAYSIIYLNNKGINLYSIITMNNLDYISPLIIVYISTIFHELGHSSACMHYNIKPGDIGFAFYFTYPCFYADVSKVWHLKRTQRAVVDIGGVYFQFVFYVLMCLIGMIIDNISLILGALLGILFFVGTFNPFIKMDGYWMLSDLMGIPNLHDATKKFLSLRIRNIFGINTEKEDVFIRDIKEKEKRFFIIYVLASIIFMTSFTFGIANVSMMTIAKLYNVINAIDAIDMNVKNIFYTFINNVALVVTTILLIRIIFTTSKALIQGIFSFVNDIKKSVRRSNIEY